MIELEGTRQSPRTTHVSASLLLLRVNLGLDDLSALAKHDNTVALHDSKAGETLAVVEGVDNERLDGLEVNLGHLVGLDGVRLLGLLAKGLLADLPVDLGKTAGRVTSADEDGRAVLGLDPH